MKPFVHKSFIGDFFDVLQAGGGKAEPGKNAAFTFGGTKRQEAVISIVSGNFDIPEIPEFVSSLDKLPTGLVKLIVLDMSRVRWFSANAVGVLVNFAASVEGRGKRLILYRPSTTVIQSLHSLALTHLFEIQHTEEELLLDLPD